MQYSRFVSAVAVCLSFCGSVYAFEPVSIDQFFEQYPNERPVQPTMPVQNNKNAIPPSLLPNSNNNKPTVPTKPTDKPSATTTEPPQDETDVPMEITANTYPKVEILLIDRILGKSEPVIVTVGKTKPLNALFDVTISECLERKNQFHNVTQIVSMKIDGYANSKKETQKTTLYNDIFYIQMPGFKGFEHPVYDIKPIKCLGTPQPITLKEEIIETEKKPESEQADKPTDAIADIITQETVKETEDDNKKTTDTPIQDIIE